MIQSPWLCPDFLVPISLPYYFFHRKRLVSKINTSAPAFFWLLLAYYIFLHPFTFNVAEFCLFVLFCFGSFKFWIQSDKICFIIGEFRLFMYRPIIGIPGLKLIIFLFSICCILCFFLLILLSSLVWIFCSHVLFRVCLLFSLDNFYWFIFRFIKYFLSCVKTTDEPKQGFLHLCCLVFDVQYFLVILSYNCHLSAHVTRLVLHAIHLFYLSL